MSKRLAKALILFFRHGVSPWLAPSCRFSPSCSTYGLRAVERFGAIKGLWLTVKRVVRCHPWGKCGHDPVPERFQWFSSAKGSDTTP